MSELNKSLGISLSGNRIIFTEILHENNSNKLNYFKILDVDFNFENNFSKYKSDQKILTNIAGEIQKILNNRGTNFSNVSLSISTAQSFIFTLPVDISDGLTSINSKIYWELSQYFPENYNDLIINTYKLKTITPSTNVNEFLVIAILKNSLEFIKRIFKLCNIKLTLIDIDHFSAENSLRCGYSDELVKSNVLLVGFKYNRIDIGYIERGRYKYYSYTEYDKEVEINLVLMKKIKHILESRMTRKGIDKVFVYGDDIREDSINALKKLESYRVEYLNPFLPISASSDFLQNDEIRKFYYKYSTSCGVALRNL